MTVDSAPRDSRSLRASLGFWLFLFFAFALAALIVEYETAMHFTGVAIDGPFQLYNALRRIQAGYKPGVDFQFFHGLGIPYLYYGLYRLLGGGLRGSELARECVNAVVYPLVFLIFFKTFLGDWRRALCLAAGAVAASFLLRLLAILFALNGMLGIRSALPTLIPVVIYLNPTWRRRMVVTGLGLGAALFISTEQGLAVTAAYVVVSLVAVIRRGERRRQVMESGGAIAIAIGTLVCCLLAIGGPAGMRGALNYNFRIVPRDQYWFFGAPPNLFISSWRAALDFAIKIPSVTACVVLGVTFAAVYLSRLWRVSEGEDGRRNFALGVLPVYGVISCASMLGTFATAYTHPCWRAVLILVGLEASRRADRLDARTGQRLWLGVPRVIAASVIILSAWTVVKIRAIPRALTLSLAHIVVDHVAGDATFGIAGIWPVTLQRAQQTIDAHRGPHGEPPTLWSTYAGWIEARNGIFHPSFDYIIHALGPDNRRKYVERFRATRPELVQTVLPAYTQYEEWLEDNDWAFYDEVLRWYTVTSVTPWSIFWERRETPGPAARLIGEMDVPSGVTTLPLPPIPIDSSAPITLVEVDVQYEIHNPTHWIPIIGESPRYLIDVEGAVSRVPVSLNPFVRETQFPVFVRAGQTPLLRFQTFSLVPGAEWVPHRIRVMVRPVDAKNRPWLESIVARAASEP